MNEYFQVNIQEIIPLVERRPVLWDRRLEFFKHKTQTQAAWDEICSTYNKAYADMSGPARSNYRSIVIRKWRNVKDSWRKNLLKSKRGETCQKKYIYDKELVFLKQGMPIIRRKPRKPPPLTPTLSGNELSSSSEFQVKSESLNMEFEEKWNQDETNTEFSACDKFQYQNESDVQDKSDTEMFLDKPEFSDTSKIAEKSIFQDKPQLLEIQAEVDKAPSFSTSRNTITNNAGLVMTESLSSKEEEENRHVSFIKGVLPSMKNFNETQVLKFQMGVIQLIQSIREDI